MGKRKSSKKPVAKKTNEPLLTSSPCSARSTARSSRLRSTVGPPCRSSLTTDLSVAVDVYCDWVDACDEINQKAKPKPKIRQRSPEPAPRFTENEDEDEDEPPRRKISSRDYDSDSDDEDDRRARKVARRAYDDDDEDDD
ncbi:hypothetical protein A1Q2_02114 [Trichosporon asahii var. asahii CBS 8904]|uniref:Transcription elongation factor 1 homolog n=1 Tax=Trichosporon asahii var. asahii (strain CBS 8904) TaxID=1220162 RepID=K1VSG8_TRIAC|nr:hypothetical protein A1Q2_02114 [Trichosporon asahii var. asahii CBS 8904]